MLQGFFKQPAKVHLAIALALRIAGIALGVYTDSVSRVRYTDIDHDVFVDAANFVAQGGSPYDRATYRYTPLVAWALVPGQWLGLSTLFAKSLFGAADLVIGILLISTLKSRGVSHSKTMALVSCTWLLNPFVINVSTRGNSESLIGVVVVGSLVALTQSQLTLSALLLGLAIHLKIYPVVFGPAIILALSSRPIWGRSFAEFLSGMSLNAVLASRGAEDSPASLSWWTHTLLRAQSFNLALVDTILISASSYGILSFLEIPLLSIQGLALIGVLTVAWIGASRLLSIQALVYALIAASTFFLLTAWMASLYPGFLDNALLYHFRRTDAKHNLSPYFLQLYLSGTSTMQAGDSTSVEALVKSALLFTPQAAAMIGLAIKYSDDVPFAAFVQTWAFVALNRVQTVQYFLWYLPLLPLVLPSSSLPFQPTGIKLIVAFVGSMLAWMGFAFLLEFQGQNTFLLVWGAGIAFFLSNIAIVVSFINHHTITPVWSQEKNSSPLEQMGK